MGTGRKSAQANSPVIASSGEFCPGSMEIPMFRPVSPKLAHQVEALRFLHFLLDLENSAVLTEKDLLLRSHLQLHTLLYPPGKIVAK